MQDYLKTVLLLGALSVLVIFLGSAIGGRQGLYFAFFFSILMNVGAYFFSDKLALSASGAKPLSKHEAPEIYESVEDLTREMKIPMPKLYITPDMQANAFATGRDPNHASVAVTQGIMNILTKDELKGVLAHELGHVKNRDILIASVAAVLASVITFVSRMSIFGGFSSDNDDNRSSGMLALLMIILAPIAAMIIQFAISRQREFEADETGAETLRNGEPLARALQKIHASVRMAPLRNANPAFSSLYIDNPLGGIGGSMLKLFSTHPPMEERVKRLRIMSFKN